MNSFSILDHVPLVGENHSYLQSMLIGCSLKELLRDKR
jgi:hypothetical protein